MELSEYNGWENKFTWLVHLHLSSEEQLMQEMTALVIDAPIGYPVGKLVEKWVIDTLTQWQMNIPHSLYRSIMNDYHLHQPVGVLMNEAPNVYACADTLKDWFEVQIDAWIDASAVRRQHNAVISVVVYNLIQSTYRVINWEHVARAFQPGY